MNKIEIRDSRTNEILQVKYDSTNRKFWINCINVARQQPLESSDAEYVFAPIDAGTQKLYHVLIEEIKSLWEAKK